MLVIGEDPCQLVDDVEATGGGGVQVSAYSVGALVLDMFDGFAELNGGRVADVPVGGERMLEFVGFLVDDRGKLGCLMGGRLVQFSLLNFVGEYPVQIWRGRLGKLVRLDNASLVSADRRAVGGDAFGESYAGQG